MSGNSAGSGNSSAAGRLVARSRRAAVRSRESPFGIPVVEIVEAQLPGAFEQAGPADPLPTPPPSPPSPGRVQPPRIAPARGSAPPATVAPPVRAEPEREPAPAPAHAPPRPAREPAAPPGDAGVPRPAAMEAQLHEAEPGPGGLPVWTFAGPPFSGARESTVRSSPPPPESPPEAARLPEPAAEQYVAHARADEPTRGATPRAYRVEPGREEPIATLQSRSPARTAASTTTGRRADPDPRPDAPAGPPQVLIDRIEVITPPARPSEPDPFRSLAAQRSGASRHERARWRE